MKKQIIKLGTVLLLIASTMIFILNGCSQKINGTNVNKKYAEKGMVNLIGEPYNYEKGTVDKGIGLGFVLTDKENELMEKEQLGIERNPRLGYTFSYITENGVKMLKEPSILDGKTDMPNITAAFFNYAAIYKIPNDSKDEIGEITMKYLTDTYSNKKAVATLKEHTYYFAWNEDYSSIDDLSEQDKKNIEALISNFDSFVNNFCIFPSSNVEKNMKNFNAKMLNGGNFTQEDFAKYDITMVNIWATWCRGCVEEMPELQAVYEKLPENMNMISICSNAGTEAELAKEILDKKGCKFPTLIPDEKLEESLLDYLDAYPTTVFVDSKGNIIGEEQIGAPSQNKEDVTDAYLNLMNEILERFSK
ncbi:TlpA family protein disulfide reductase [Alkaliphilus oremlandii]|uniref:TlpA family protein disulfide reductase n=1 Tax=Alkaliphilus oremlandii TaxID=461876 RepID=UPI0000D825AA|nr:TlpA disulfide reductase family protein [Alkaliphilus oremlandii]